MSRPNDLAEREDYLQDIRARFAVAIKNADESLALGIISKLQEDGYVFEAESLQYQWDTNAEVDI